MMVCPRKGIKEMEFVVSVIHVWMVKNHPEDTNYKILLLDCKDESGKYHMVVHVTMNWWRMMGVSLDLSCLLVQVGFVDWVGVEVPVTAVKGAVVVGRVRVQKVLVSLWKVVHHKKDQYVIQYFRESVVEVRLDSPWNNTEIFFHQIQLWLTCRLVNDLDSRSGKLLS